MPGVAFPPFHEPISNVPPPASFLRTATREEIDRSVRGTQSGFVNCAGVHSSCESEPLGGILP
jgi:hypothetical protein